MNHQRIEPGPGQESVWDYPRPPRVEETARHVKVVFDGEVIADTRRARRVLETSHPPVYYIPPEDVRMEYLTETGRRTWCEWKGQAGYYSLRRKRAASGECCLVLSTTHHRLQRDPRTRGLLPGKDGCLLRGWRAGPGSARRLLRRLDHR